MLIPIDEFCETHSLKPIAIQTMVSREAMPPKIYHVEGRKAFVDEELFLKYVCFNRKVIRESRNNFKFLIQRVGKATIAKILAENTGKTYNNWFMFFNSQLEHPPTNLLAELRVNNRMWDFWRISSRIVRDFKIIEQSFKKYDYVKKDISKWVLK